eukprot:SAG22_NODE_16477_length_324_cov_0.920000_1_plen_74_part_10
MCGSRLNGVCSQRLPSCPCSAANASDFICRPVIRRDAGAIEAQAREAGLEHQLQAMAERADELAAELAAAGAAE